MQILRRRQLHVWNNGVIVYDLVVITLFGRTVLLFMILSYNHTLFMLRNLVGFVTMAVVVPRTFEPARTTGIAFVTALNQQESCSISGRPPPAGLF